MRPLSIPKHIQDLFNLDYNSPSIHEAIKKSYLQIEGPDPEVSIIIPAYNEETTIVQTLASLCYNKVDFPVEIIVVNNNSKDKTEELVNKCGISCITETKQGITNARNCGLNSAKGKFVLNADADTIYPKDWITEMSKPLKKSSVAITYGRFAFIPVGDTGRNLYYFYEYLADFSRTLNKYIKDEAVNVYGFNSGFRREQGLSVEGFNHPPGTNEDGWMAVKLREKGFGKLHLVSSPKALVWTTDRRIQMDGGLFPGLKKRANRILKRK